MNFHVYNRDLLVHHLDIKIVSSSSLVLIGDANELYITSVFDTPLDSLIFSPLVPLNP